MIYNADDLRRWSCFTDCGVGKWVCARPLRYAPIPHRIRTAWRVFTGRYDALEWTEQPNAEGGK